MSQAIAISALVISLISLAVFSVMCLYRPGDSRPLVVRENVPLNIPSERYTVGDLILLQAQTDPQENGFYFVEPHGVMTPAAAHPPPERTGVSVDQPRPITPNEMNQPVIVTKADVSMPDPSELGMNKAGNMRLVMIANSSDSSPIELGFSSKWNSRCDTTSITEGCASAFVFFMTTDVDGEIFRIG
jgi:hypothetical protein